MIPYDSLGKDFSKWLLRKEGQGLLMPCADDATPLLTHEEARTLAMLSDAIDSMKRAL